MCVCVRACVCYFIFLKPTTISGIIEGKGDCVCVPVVVVVFFCFVFFCLFFLGRYFLLSLLF